MTLEQLQSMSNRELDELAAIKLLWDGFVNVPSDEWRPTEDMNDAMKLIQILHSDYWNMNLYLDYDINNPWKCKIFFSDGFHPEQSFIHHDKTAPRCITITAILASGDE